MRLHVQKFMLFRWSERVSRMNENERLEGLAGAPLTRATVRETAQRLTFLWVRLRQR